jgi:hypothetical protein
MDDDTAVIEDNATTDAQKSWASRHPKVMILLIAGIFYLILFSMCGFVLVLLLRG